MFNANASIYQVHNFGMHIIFFSFSIQHDGFPGTLRDSQMFLITLCIHPIKQLARDIINTMRRSKRLINHPFFRNRQCSGKKWHILILLNSLKNVLVHLPDLSGTEQWSAFLTAKNFNVKFLPLLPLLGKIWWKLGWVFVLGKPRKSP